MTGDVSRRITAAAILLTIGTGGTDVTSFTRLGGVFTSVMTANLTLLGLSIVTRSGLLAGHLGLAFAGYAAGVAAGARVSGLRAGDRVALREQEWPPMVTVVLAIELVLLAGLTVGWEVTGGHPAGAGQYLLQAIAAMAMGMQSAAVRGLGAGNFSTTYLTGQLTGIVTGLVTPGQRSWPGWYRLGPVIALAAGGLLGGVLIAYAPAALPVLTFVPLCLVVAFAARARHRVDAAR
ncbi:MAG: YoaK family protein [Streptosporangiaceae bacterium]